MNIHELTEEQFLERNRITQPNWEKADISFDILKSIALDHQSKIPSLDEASELLAKIMQKCPEVHSVRWRVKDAEHLITKIVRKRSEDNEKYLTIDINNYSEIITDLVGVRVLHLFKYEWKNIHEHIHENWTPSECPVAYIRSGDEGTIIDNYKENNCDVKVHPIGYRSIHYVITTQPTKIKINSEIQVRTIFEEGWSEIDHKIRYPNFSDNELVSYFLTIFNRLAGSADEMGSFVNDLAKALNHLEIKISEQEKKVAEISDERDKHLSKIEKLIAELSSEKEVRESNSEKIKELNIEITKLRTNTYAPTVKQETNSYKSAITELGMLGTLNDRSDTKQLGMLNALSGKFPISQLGTLEALGSSIDALSYPEILRSIIRNQ